MDKKDDKDVDDLIKGMQELTTNTEKVEQKEKLEDIEKIAKMIKEGKAKRIIIMSGAGISVAAGIPDFRTPGTGLYDNLQKYNLPRPTAVFEIDFFKKNPKPFYQLAKELYPGLWKPTASHYFIKLLEEKALLLRNFTQNIDTLEVVSGISDDRLVFAHGSFSTAHCTNSDCKKEYTKEYVRDFAFKEEVPLCEKCNSTIKPDIVFFGESLPLRFHEQLKLDFPQCDLLIVMGTSLTVYPFASLVDLVDEGVPRILANREKVGPFKKSTSETDFVFQGDCDAFSLKLAELLGWKEELEKLHKEGHEKLDKSIEELKKNQKK
eukprot:TRINITY_DN17168_c0_g1_i1.p1 TRINITY_DN17168_c0_g1~~TRINITY_DN17168_c0_g1_i1.p1  ORF type:complete len:321 (-),score=94.72 TRINITY_DN17168_c0_g1_i1:3-965(-)